MSFGFKGLKENYDERVIILSNSRLSTRILVCVSLCKVLGALLVIATVRGGHLGQSGGHGSPAVSTYGAPVGGTAYSAPSGYNEGYNAGYNGGYNGGSSYSGPGYSSGGQGGYDEQVNNL
jgi:uncharacterized membrane protein